MKHNIGLTGLIGSGKSLAATYFAELGANIIDTDRIAHAITHVGGLAIPHIEDSFGSEVITLAGALDRQKMRQLAFRDKSLRIKLESIIHPIIFEQVLLAIEQSVALYNVLVVPLLFKAEKYLNIIQYSIFVDCEEDTLIRRVVKRSNMTEDEVRAIIHTQVSRDMQISLADDILDNNTTEGDLFTQVKQLDKKYRSLFIHKP